MPSAHVTLVSVSPYSQSNFIVSKKHDNESDNDWESRVCVERLHLAPDGHVCIPAAQLSGAVKNGALLLTQKVPGTGGKGTYRKHFDSGVFVYDNLILPVKRDAVEWEWLMLPSNPNNPKSGRVPKCMPKIAEWTGVVVYTIYDQVITETIFAEALRLSGIQVGIGRWRPEKKGIYGRYKVKELRWQKEE